MYSKDLIERYVKVATASIADTCDKIVGRRCFMDYEIRPRINDKKIVGPAVTVLEGPACGEDVAPNHALDALEEGVGGQVMVIQVTDQDRNVAVWGGIMTSGAYVKNWAGAILDAAVRDVAEIRRDYDFPVYSRSISPGTTLGRYKTYASNVPVVCGGIEVHPDDMIVADIDGVVVVPKAHVTEVLEAAEKIDEKEALQAKLIRETGSLKEGMAKYNRI